MIWILLAACGRITSPPTPPADRLCPPDRPGPFQCLVQVPAGTFWMGAQATDPAGPNYDPVAAPEEGPVHEVELDAFWITAAEVTSNLFRHCVEKGACQVSDILTEGGYVTWSNDDGMPALGVTWKGAQDACRYLGGRLPTEAEWEYAARGTDGRRFPWGSDERCAAFQLSDGARQAAPQGFCPRPGPYRADDGRHPSPFRLTAMAGNAWEWVLDAWDPHAYSQHARKNPQVAEGAMRVQRGGAWTAESSADQRSAMRAAMPPEEKVFDVGFRCVWTGTP